MPTVAVDLPAQNVTTAYEGSSAALVVGGPGALSTRSTDSYVRMDSATNNWSFRVGYGDTGFEEVDSFGIGLWDKPAGAEITSAIFVAEGYRESSGAHGDFPQDDYDNAPSHTSPVISTYPFLMLSVDTEVFHPTVSTFPLDAPGEALGQAEWYDPSVLVPRPLVEMATYPFPIVPMALVLTYLAIRVTYTVPDGIPPRRIVGRPDGATNSAPRVYAGGNTRQSGPKTHGSIL